MRDLAATSLLTAWCSLVAALVGRRTLRANWRRMHLLHLSVLRRMQGIEGAIVASRLGDGVPGWRVPVDRDPQPPMPPQGARHRARTIGTPGLDRLLCTHDDTPTTGRPPRRARRPDRRPVVAGVRVTTRLAAAGTAAVMAVAAATLAVR